MFLITGAAGGLGKAFAVECASRGWDLFLTDMEAERLAMLATALRNTYDVTVVTYACDLTDLASRDALFDALHACGMMFQGLISVAGIEHEGLFCDRSRDALRTIVRLNVEATVDVTRMVLDCPNLSSPFRIITVSSLAAFFPMPVKATYAASKRFLLDFSLALREEVRDRGVTVTVLCPAGLPTTERAIRGIEVQGVFGYLGTKMLGKVIARTVDHALKGDAVYVPGFLPRLLLFLSSFLPPVILARVVGMRWRAAHRRSARGIRKR